MRLRVDLLPGAPPEPGEVVVLVDVLRTCTVAPILFDRGATRVTLSPSLRAARHAAAAESALLIGERAGLPPEGFNHGTSPSELSGRLLDGKRVVMVSDNAPNALRTLLGTTATGTPPVAVLLAGLYNASAVAERAVALAADRIRLVACGFRRQEDLDDTLAAGVVAAAIRHRAPHATLEGGAQLALGLVRCFPDPIEALWESLAGHELRRMQAAADLALASLVDQSTVVPRLTAIAAGAGGPLYAFEDDR